MRVFKSLILLLAFGLLQPIFAQKKPVSEVLYETINGKGVEAAVKEYWNLKKHHSEEYDFSEAQLNNLGYKLLGENKTRAAVDIFKLNLEAYPKSINVYDSLAEAYLANGNNDLAVEYYEKMLSMLPGSNLNDVQKAFFTNNADLNILKAKNFNNSSLPSLIYYAYFGGNPAGRWDMENLIDFKARHPGMSIDYQSFNLYARPVPQNIDTIFESEIKPDVVSGFVAGVFRKYIKSGKIANLADLWQKEGWEQVFPESIQKLVSYDGAPYFVPQALQWNPIWYRVDIFKKVGLQPPKTWEDMLDICDRLNAAGYVPFTISATGWPPPVARWFTILNLRLNGPEFHNQVAQGKIPFTDARIRKVFEYWATLFEHHAFADTSVKNNWAAGVKDLVSGAAAMYNIGEWIFESQAVAAQSENLDFFPFPVINPNVTSAEIVHVYGAFMLADAAHPQTAKELLRYLASTESQNSNASALNRIVSNAKVYAQLTKIQQRQYDFIKNTAVLVPLFELNTEPQMAQAALAAFVKFWGNPSNIDDVLHELENVRQEIFLSN